MLVSGIISSPEGRLNDVEDRHNRDLAIEPAAQEAHGRKGPRLVG